MLSLFRPRGVPARIVTSFRWLEARPFPSTRAEHYAAQYDRGSYALTLRRDSYFAWETMSTDQRFADVSVEAEIEVDPSNGHSAAGLLFRHVDDENFYSFLVSTRGNFRIDLLFNNHPLHLVEWTALPASDPEDRRNGAQHPVIGIVAHGSRFSFLVDDEWVAELEDETLPEGGIGFAAQNFAGAGTGVFRMRRFALDARPLDVERDYLRASYYAPVSPASRLRLAETFVGMGSVDQAIVQLRKALKDREGSARERSLLAQCYARRALYDEALAEIDRVLAMEPANADARMEKANLLYLANRLLEARDLLSAALADGTIRPDATAWNLLGNAEYGLGNHEKAVQAYQRSTEKDPSPLILTNAARALERAGRPREALDHYLRAARLLFAEEAFDELSIVMPRVLALAPQEPEVRGLEAKMFYREGKTDEAFAILRDLAAAGSTDSAVHYLLGILLSARDAREEALERFERAAELAPDFALYHFRLAETRHILGRDPGPALQRALALAPSDAWANNLAGLLRIEAGDPAGALEPLQRARSSSPTEADIALNLSEALSLTGRHDEALAAIGDLTAAVGDSARSANQRGNILARRGERDSAVREYEAAIRLDPDNEAYKENCAAACIEIDMVHRAEELLAQIEPDHPSASVYNLLGQVAALKGERARAELAFSEGLRRDPGNPDLTANLAIILRERGNYEGAKELLTTLLAARRGGHERAAALLARMREERERRFVCASCGREWWAPKVLAPQPALRIRGEPPAEAPGGRCPRCERIYCVGCASANVRDMRFVCPHDEEFLKLSDDALKWLLRRALESASGDASS
jgi:tetratricopeptide (TPR) repeat protein